MLAAPAPDAKFWSLTWPGRCSPFVRIAITNTTGRSISTPIGQSVRPLVRPTFPWRNTILRYTGMGQSDNFAHRDDLHCTGGVSNEYPGERAEQVMKGATVEERSRSRGRSRAYAWPARSESSSPAMESADIKTSGTHRRPTRSTSDFTGKHQLIDPSIPAVRAAARSERVSGRPCSYGSESDSRKMRPSASAASATGW